MTRKLLFLILLLGIFFRSYKAYELFMLNHDHDLWAWVIRDILENRHLRLIGQETSVQGVFIGGLYYYLLIPFLLIFNMDPRGGIFLSIIIGGFAILSYYFVISRVFNKQTGLIGALIYAVSLSIVFTDREVVPTMPVMMWAVWFFYALYLVLKGKQRQGFLLAGLLVSIIWHLNLGLVLVIPLVLVALFLSHKKVQIRSMIEGIAVSVIFSLPLLAFEIRHGYQQVNAILGSLSHGSDTVYKGFDKFVRVIYLVSKNIVNLLWGDTFNIPYVYVLVALIGLFVWLFVKERIEKNIGIIMSLWFIFYIGFFSFNSLFISEYYLNGLTPLWVITLALGISYLVKQKKLKIVGYSAVVLFILINCYRLFTFPQNKSGFLYRRAIVQEIKKDALSRKFPCVAVSYITEPGYELGYRYLFYYEKVKVMKPNSNAPVYTIVFPHTKVDKIDQSFGALGLIYPEYEKYTEQGVQESCSGEDSNISDPLFGFTQ